MSYPSLVPDDLEWDEWPNERYLAVIVPADADRLPGLATARRVLDRLPVVPHPDHYLHCTLRELGPADEIDSETLDAIGNAIASEPAWTARVAGLEAWPTAIWADPDPEGRMTPLLQKILGSIGTLDESPFLPNPRWHLTLAYSQGHMSAVRVREILEPYSDLELGTIEVHEAIAAELHFTEPYPRWTVVRRFPFAGA